MTASNRAIRLVTASIWILFGLGFKVLELVPRHRLIVAAVVGETLAGPVTLAVGLGETALGLWILGGYRPRLCAAAQTLAIVSMNALELAYARERLLAPVPMLLANTVFLALAWYAALRAGPPTPVRGRA